MAEFRPASPEQAEFMERLLDAGLLIASGVHGVYGRGEDFERIRIALEAMLTDAGAHDQPERLRFPPLLPRRQLERSGYLSSFPHLAGAIFGFQGSEEQAIEQSERAGRHEDWSEHQHMTELVLTPAACYPVYPAVATRGPLDPRGITVDLAGSYVFRHEPSGDPARLQMFHQHEIVRIGSPEVVQQWRDTWRARALELLEGLGLDAKLDVASDPFFGRSGRMLAASQRAQALKFEIHTPIAGPEPTAVASFNYHQDHFAEAHGIELTDGSAAHTACLGFGHERITLALLSAHGLDTASWPDQVCRRLWS